MDDATLIVLDFDCTFADKNTDTFVWRLGENGTIPDSIKKSGKLWTELMQDVFNYLFELGVTSAQILECIGSMELAPGMQQLLFNIPECYDIIIVSDSNSVFIDHILETQGLQDRIMRVLTNPASFDEQGRLVVTPFTEQSECPMCERNICKWDALASYRDKMSASGKTYCRVLYMGDGRNDVCPSLKLSERDTVFARSGYKLEETLAKLRDSKKENISADVISYLTADILLDHL